MKTLVYDRKRLKEIDKQFKLASKELKRMGKLPPLTPAEAKELRAEQQRQRRANKALSEVVL